MFYYDYFWILIPFLLLVFWAQSNVKSTFTKYTKVQNARNMTGYDAAQLILRNNNMDVSITTTPQSLGDHYDPRTKVLALSPEVYGGTSIASVAVAAHEVGHSIQDAQGYGFLKFRNAFAPVAMFASQIAPLLIIGSFISSFQPLMVIGIILFSAGVLFQVITLPVEFDASARAIDQLVDHGVISMDEKASSKKVLKAAALTYVAAALYAIANIVRLLLISNRRR